MGNLFRAFMATVAICSVASMTSCSSDDDDNSKKDQQEKPNFRVVPAYKAGLSESVLELYDVKVVLSNGVTTKEVTLTKTNCTVSDSEFFGSDVKVCDYMFTDKDIEGGVKSVVSTVTPKADIETILKSKDPEKTVPMDISASLFTAYVYQNDHYVDANTKIERQFYSETAGDLLKETGGKIEYITTAENIQKTLTRK